MPRDIHAEIRALQKNAGWSRTRSSGELVDAWESLVKQTEDGYGFSIYEFDNDLAVRDAIELVISNVDLRSHPAGEDLERNVRELDRRFKSALLDGVSIRPASQPWWRRGVLRKAGKDYARDVEEQYGVQVDLV